MDEAADNRQNGNKPLTSFPPGSRVLVADYLTGRKARGRMCSLGLTPGTPVEILSTGPGPCRIKVRGADLLVGRGLANRILAKPTDPPLQ